LFAALAATALVASVFATGPAAAAPKTPTKPVRPWAIAKHRQLVRNTATHGLPRLLQHGAAGLPAGVPQHGSYAFLLRLSTSSTLDVYRNTAPRGRLIARASAKSQLQVIKQAQSRVIAALPGQASVLYKTHSVLAGVAVIANVHDFGALRAIRGVQAVYPIAPKSVSNSYAMPLQHAPQAWAAPSGHLGDGVKIAVIDTGIDYTHADFGGPGTTLAYHDALLADTNPPTYPDPAKVADGEDLVGDAYDASDPNNNQPQQDSNPLDCSGHGSHVAGIAAGYGTNASDGTTYPHADSDYTSLGALSTSAYQALFRIGPGMAPHATLYAYKVFGCGENATTDVVAKAIDTAVDPNNDGDPSDGASVINMSLGADYSSAIDGDSIAANIASRKGVVVVAAAGNGGDEYDISGAPGNAQRAISVANSVDAYSQLDTLHASVNGSPEDYRAQRSAAYDWAADPDLAGNVVALSQAANADGCEAYDQADATAAAGRIVFLTWTDNDANRRCGSAQRATNAFHAHAIGVILGEDEETFAAGILGSAAIPMVQVVKSAADDIAAALGAGQPVTVSGTTAADFSQLIPANDNLVNTSSSRGIRANGDVKPDVAAVGTSVFSTAMGTGDQGVSESGTSMATPMVAGLAALVRSVNPGWTPEQVKADIMNTAGQDLYSDTGHTHLYAPNRVGAGRIRVDRALDNSVLAYVQDNPGAVSVSFGPVAVTKAVTLTKTVDVVNKSAAPATYAVRYAPITKVPGVSYQVSKSSLTVPAGGTNTFTVKFVVTDPTALRKTHDVTKPPMSLDLGPGGVHSGEYLADASGRVELTPDIGNTAGATSPLRVPVYSAPRPASVMSNRGTLTLPGSGVQFANLKLTGKGVAQGSGANRVQSLVSGFELQAKSGLAPSCTSTRMRLCVAFGADRSADLKYVGTSSDYPLLQAQGDPFAFGDAEAYFAITTQRPWRTPVGPQEFDVLIDTNGDNIADAIVYNTRLGEGDLFLSELIDVTSANPAHWFVRDDELINDRFGEVDTALFDSDTMVFPVWLDALRTAGGSFPPLPSFGKTDSRVRYGVVSVGEGGIVDNIGVNVTSLLSGGRPRLNSAHLATDLAHTGIEVANSSIFDHALFGALLNNDKPGTAVSVRRDVAQYNRDHAKGLLMVHFQNTVGSKAKIVTLKSKPKVSISLSASSVQLNHAISATIKVANTAGHVATGKVVLHRGSGAILRQGRLTKGQITFTWRPGARGAFAVYAVYKGDANYAARRSAKVGYRVT
jgi:subtilisin family serine protease